MNVFLRWYDRVCAVLLLFGFTYSAGAHRWLLAALYFCLLLSYAVLIYRLPLFREVREIRSRDGKNLYLTRYFILGHTKSRYALMLHHMHQPDDDECHHDHPWWFWTLILKGGYEEEVSAGTLHGWGGGAYEPVRTGSGLKRVWNTPGTLRYRPAEHTHRISFLLKGSCWTLVLRGQRKRSWGFHTDKGWVWWQDFIRTRHAVAWCGDGLKRGYRWMTGKGNEHNEVVVPKGVL